MTAATPGQAAYEAPADTESPGGRLLGWAATLIACAQAAPEMDASDWRAGADNWRAAYVSVAAREPHAAPGEALLLDPLHALAAKWDATAARNQRNGQSLIDQGDEYGNEGLAVAEALGACVVDLRAVLADAPPAQPAPEFPAAGAALARVLSWFTGNGTRREAIATRAQLAHAHQDGGLTVPEELRRFL